MTERALTARYKKGGRVPFSRVFVPLVFFSAIIFIAVFKSNTASEQIISGFLLAAKKVLPTAFPFMIISDLYLAFGRCEDLPFIKLLARIFRINERGMSPFIVGNVFGFPLGAKGTGALLSENVINKKEAELLAPLSNAPSLPFVIGVVGTQMYSSLSYGVILYLSVLSSSLLCGFILSRIFCGKPRRATPSRENKKAVKYDFTDSVKNAALSSLYICAFISLASLIGGILDGILPCGFPSFLTKTLTEVTSGCDFLVSQSEIPTPYTLPLCAFCLGFGGLSVFLQTLPFLPSFTSAVKYLAIKLLQGGVSALLAFCCAALLSELGVIA